MNHHLIRIILISLAILASVSSDAKIPVWSIPPTYHRLQRFAGDIFLFEENGKYGLVRAGNKILLEAKYDFIYPFVNGYSIAGAKAGNSKLLQAIIGEDGSVAPVNGTYYTPAGNNCFSEGKILVLDKKGKYGFINTVGDIAVKCQFDKALPFKEGWASVKQGNYSKYISENYDRNPRSILTVDFHYGEMTMASCFRNDRAVIAYNKDFALINKSGKKIKKIGEKEFLQLYKSFNAMPLPEKEDSGTKPLYEVFSRGGYNGLKEGGEVILYPQFDSFGTQYADVGVITDYDGKQGLLKFVDGNIEASVSANELEADRKGKISPVSVDIIIPQTVAHPKVIIDNGNGEYHEYTGTEFESRSGNRYTFTITPMVPKNAETCTIRVAVENVEDGIILADFDDTLVINYPVKLRVTPPGANEIWANKAGTATFSSTIFNDSAKDVSVKAIWSTGDEVTVTIPAHGSRRISGSIHVAKDFTKEISVRLSTGEKASNTIQFFTDF